MKFSRHIYLDDEVPVDAELKLVADGKGAQKSLRDRMRTGHVIHRLIGDQMARNLHEYLDVPEEEMMEAIIDLLRHHAKLMARKKGKKMVVPDAITEKPVLVSEPEKPKAKRGILNNLPGF